MSHKARPSSPTATPTPKKKKKQVHNLKENSAGDFLKQETKLFVRCEGTVLKDVAKRKAEVGTNGLIATEKRV